jgi:peptidoglycan/LPS O-acetylase OafA/YrhL
MDTALDDRQRVARPYRPEIDGLRGISVLVVLLYHAELGGFTGGFIGVDVFFVISGFLITSNILAEVKSRTFSFAEFYARRARRLFPALYVTLVATFLCGTLLLSPHHLRLLARSMLHALSSTSNFLFWSEDGYFDEGSRVKPLLHTWSLSVEEQFYLVWPCILVALLRFGRTWMTGLFLASSAIASLGLALSMEITDPAGSFFLAPCRVMEFAIGAGGVWLVGRPPRNGLWLEPVLAIGLAAVVAPALMYDGDVGTSAVALLLPCIGAALVIYAGGARTLGRALRSPVATGLGIISYSLYLAHWPIIVFYRYYKMHPLTDADRLGLAAGSVAAAALMYRLVERPFRRVVPAERRSPARFGATCLGLALLSAIPAASAWYGVGWDLRTPPEISRVLNDFDRGKVWEQWDAAVRTGKCELNDATGTFEDLVAHSETCLGVRAGQANILVSGDSLAADLWAALHSGYPDVNFLQATGPRCVPLAHEYADPGHRCNRMLSHLKQSFDAPNSIDGVILSGRWQRKRIHALAAEVHDYERRNIPVVVVGPTPEFEPSVPTLVSRFGRLDGLESFAHRFRIQEPERVNAALRALTSRLRVPFVDRIGLFCDGSRCAVLDDHRRLMFIDYGHWTVEGQRFAGKRLAAKYPTIQAMFATGAGGSTIRM